MSKNLFDFEYKVDIAFIIPTIIYLGAFAFYYIMGYNVSSLAPGTLFAPMLGIFYMPLLCLVFIPSAINLTSIPQSIGIALRFILVNFVDDMTFDPTNTFLAVLFYWVPTITTYIQVASAVLAALGWLAIIYYESTLPGMSATDPYFALAGVVEAITLIAYLDFYPQYISNMEYFGTF